MDAILAFLFAWLLPRPLVTVRARQRGFTLIEMILAFVIFCLFILACALIYAAFHFIAKRW